MKDKNGIEIKCENCEYRKPCLECDTCKQGGFTPKRLFLEARIAELQAREFTRAELEYIGASLRVGDVGCKDEYEAYKKPIFAKCEAALKGGE